jgi:predicted polyphosphate/ATP-dependent NAD kinase
MAERVGKIGFLINPIAGMGGAVGLKGTDGLAYAARARGAKPLAATRARACLHLLSPEIEKLLFFAASGEMGEDELKECGLQYTVAYVAAKESSSLDTRLACHAFLENGVDLILFCGGDGTARDVARSAGMRPQHAPHPGHSGRREDAFRRLCHQPPGGSRAGSGLCAWRT